MDWINFLKKPGFFKAALIFVLIFAALKLIEYLAQRHTKAHEKRFGKKIVYYSTCVFRRASWFLFLSMALYASSWALEISSALRSIIDKAFIIALVIYVIWALHNFFSFQEKKLQDYNKDRRSEITSVKLVVKFLELGLFVFLVLFLLKSVLGYNIEYWLTALGVGGVIVALSLQGFFSDTISSLVIFWDRPFEVGDFVEVKGHHGRIKKIGLRSTYIQTPRGEEIVISNRQLISEILYNYSKKESTELKIKFGLGYDFKREDLPLLDKAAQKAIDAVDIANKQRVDFSHFSPAGMMFDFRYDLRTTDFKKIRQFHEEISFRFKENLEKEGIQIFSRQNSDNTEPGSDQFSGPDTL